MSDEKNLSTANVGAPARTGKRPRRIFIVDARLQYKIIFHLFLLSALVGLLGALLTAFYLLHLTSSHPGQDPNAHLQVVFLGLTVAASALLIVAIVGIFISHAIAGPVHRFRQVMRALADKRPVPAVTLRRHDYFHGMAEDFEVLITALKSETEATARTAREASEGIARVAGVLQASGKADPALLAELGQIQERLAQAAGEAETRKN